MKNFLGFLLAVFLFLCISHCNYKKDEIEDLEEEKLRLEIKNLKLDLQIDSIKKRNIEKL